MNWIAFAGMVLAGCLTVSGFAWEIRQFQRAGGFGQKRKRRPPDPPKEGREGCPTCGEILHPHKTTCPVCKSKY